MQMIKVSWQKLLGDRIRQKRLYESMNQADFGDFADVAQAQVSRFENGDFERHSKNLHKLCNAWNIAMDSAPPAEAEISLDQLANLRAVNPIAAQAVDVLVHALTRQ